MPELPEVETIRRQLQARYLGKKIISAAAKPVKIFREISADDFVSQISGKTISGLHRYGKFMYWDLGDVFPVFHLGMSGIFLTEKSYSKFPRHIHLEIQFEDDWLYFQDVRKFGKILLSFSRPQFPALGVDPTSEKFTLKKFKEILNLKAIRIKSLLMDQKYIAGIGNIYASEALFLAGIHPEKPANQIRGTKAGVLYDQIKIVLNDAIERFGTTYSAYQTVTGQSGTNQDFLNVYQRHNEPCKICQSAIQKIIIESRSTFFCKKCQK